MSQLIEDYSELLDEAARNSSPTFQLSKEAEISLKEAYDIQARSIERRYDRGESLTGLKMGFTSKAKMEQMGVSDMIWGRLTDAMEIENGGEISMDRYIHPRAEPEIAFLLKEDITHEIKLNEVINVIDGLAPAIEVIDSRYKDFKFSLEDVIADNCSSTGYVVGMWRSPGTDISDLLINIRANEKVQQSGSSKAILGNPMQSLVEAVRLALQYGQELKKGMIILAGAATSAIAINKGDKIEASFGELGTLTFQAI